MRPGSAATRRDGRNHRLRSLLPPDIFRPAAATNRPGRLLTLNDAWVENVDPPADLLPDREVLEMATVNGVAVANLAGRTGSLTPGKRADVVVIDGKAPNVAPVIDPVGAVVISADVSNVDTLIIDGVIKKEGGKLVGIDLDRARGLIEASRDYLVSELAKKQADA